MADFATVAEFNVITGMAVDSGRGAAMLAAASAEIRLHAGQDYEAVTGRQESRAASGRAYFTLKQRPVTALAITVDGVAFTDFEWTEHGKVNKADWSAWDEGPIVATYDSGYAAGSDEMEAIKSICIEVAARALGGPSPSETFGLETPEARGWPVSIFLQPQEMERLDKLAVVAVG